MMPPPDPTLNTRWAVVRLHRREGLQVVHSHLSIYEATQRRDELNKHPWFRFSVHMVRKENRDAG